RRRRGGGARYLGAGGPKGGGAPDRALDGVREGALWPERQGAVRLRRGSRLDQPLLRRLRDSVAAAPDQVRADCGAWYPGEAAGNDEAQERRAAGDLQPSSALLLLGRQGGQGHVPARKHAQIGRASCRERVWIADEAIARNLSVVCVDM